MSESEKEGCPRCIELAARLRLFMLYKTRSDVELTRLIRENRDLNDKNVELTQLESKIRDLNEEIDELRGYNGTLAMRCKRLTDELYVARTGRPVED